MKKIVVGVLASVIGINSVAASGWDIQPYVGLDAQVRHMSFKQGFGDNMFKHYSPQGNVYGGLKFSRYVGLEMGYEFTQTRSRDSKLSAGDVSLGSKVEDIMEACSFHSKAKLKGPHMDVVGFYTFDNRYPLQLIGSVGVSVLTATFERQTVQVASQATNTVRKIERTKAVARLGGGIQHMFTKNIGARLTVNWINTARAKAYSNDLISPAATIKPKNSTVFGLGMLWKF